MSDPLYLFQRKKFEVDLSQLPKSACELLDNELLIFLGERLYTGCHPALGTAPCLVAYHKNTLQTEQGTRTYIRSSCVFCFRC